MTTTVPYERILTEFDAVKPPHILLGNGFSRACRDDIFAYGALFDRADFSNLSPSARSSFDALTTTDFEVVMRALRNASALVRLYSREATALISQLEEDANGLREVLVKAIAESHPEQPSEIDDEAYSACRRFLVPYKHIYTLNYDLLLYWALMHNDVDPAIKFDDGFRTPTAGRQEYVTWDIENTNRQTLFYLHGALHLFDGGDELQKYTWINTGVRLIEQVRRALAANLYPLFVAEGESAQKMDRIRHSDFLSRGLRSFANISGTLVVYGHSFAPNDEHVIRLIEKGKMAKIFVSLYGDPDSSANRAIVARVNRMQAGRHRSRPIDAVFFDAATAKVWG